MIVVVAVAAGLGLSVALHHRDTSGPPAPGAVTTTPPRPDEIVPGAGQALLIGTLTSLRADNAVGPPLTPPFTITIASRGQGSADITGVAVAGETVEIYWYGGQPLPVSGTGELAVDGGAIGVDASGLTWMLDGAPRSLRAGHYYLGAPVAVGHSGLAQPRQSVAFDAGDRSTLLTKGRAQVHLPPAAVHLTGPGSVILQGDFQLRSGTGAGEAPGGQHVHSVVFGPGSYAMDLTPVAAGDTIQATLQGPVNAT